MVEPETAFADLHANADLAEALLKSIFQALLIERADDEAAGGQALGKAFPLQCAQGLPHRVPRSREHLCQITFHQPVAGFVNTRFDGLENKRVGVFLHGSVLCLARQSGRRLPGRDPRITKP